MKKVILYVFLSLLVSCVKTTEEAPSFDVEEIVFFGGAVNESQTVKVRAAGEWTIDGASIPEWLTVSPLSGLDSGEVTITVNFVNNTNGDRSFDLLLDVSGYSPATLRILQKFGTPEELTDGMLNKTVEGCYQKGKEVFVLDQATMQIGVNADLRNYFLISDDQTKILSLTFNTLPQLYSNSYISVQSRGFEVEAPVSGEFMLYKRQEGKLWFYNPTKKLGFITREISE